jgi:hypothetical protein
VFATNSADQRHLPTKLNGDRFVFVQFLMVLLPSQSVETIDSLLNLNVSVVKHNIQGFMVLFTVYFLVTTSSTLSLGILFISQHSSTNYAKLLLDISFSRKASLYLLL